MPKIVHGGLREAYLGYYEEDWEVGGRYREFVKNRNVGDTDIPDYATWLETEVDRLASVHTPSRRLEIYCEWNGILGYHGTLYEIAHGGGVGPTYYHLNLLDRSAVKVDSGEFPDDENLLLADYDGFKYRVRDFDGEVLVETGSFDDIVALWNARR